MFTKEAAAPINPKWDEMIKREHPLYSREGDIRSDFGRDYTRILHSTAYRRLKHKTQVFSSPQNDHICTRIEHVGHVESVSYTIAKYLGLNTELTKAISIAHDLGHAPFGHCGEEILSGIANDRFWHEKQGLRLVDKLELLEDNTGKRVNLNLTYAVRDGIISHCGEVDDEALYPRLDAIDLNDYKEPNQLPPYTWEGCVVKISDKISYLGRDLEDALTLKILSKEQKDELKSILSTFMEIEGLNNTVLIYEFIMDLCANSSLEKGLTFSPKMHAMMKLIKDFNYKNIYNLSRLNGYKDYAKLALTTIFNTISSAYSKDDTKNELKNLNFRFVQSFIHWIEQYWDIDGKSIYNVITDKHSYETAIIDYIAGMTDIYAEKVYKEIISF